MYSRREKKSIPGFFTVVTIASLMIAEADKSVSNRKMAGQQKLAPAH